MTLGLRKSTTIRIIHQLCGPHLKSLRDDTFIFRCQKQVEEVTKGSSRLHKADIDKEITWDNLRLVCIPLGAKEYCLVKPRPNKPRPLISPSIKIVSRTDLS